MQRPAKRNCSVKALQAIKENSLGSRVARSKKKMVDTENVPPGTKRHSSPTAFVPPNPKRKTFGDITNAIVQLEPTDTIMKPQIKHMAAETVAAVITEEVAPPTRRSIRLKEKGVSTQSHTSPLQPMETTSSVITEETPVTAVQNILKATTLADDSLRCEECLPEDDVESIGDSVMSVWKDIDSAEAHDHLFSSEYAPEIYEYMKRREITFTVEPYLDSQPFINSSMRSILVDWLVEVQENFELFHETLYLAVKVVDRYLERKEVKKEYLQLVGATAMLVASKFEELSPPLVDDFIYLCDDAYTHRELLQMEYDILCTMDYDLNTPVAYRFLRRYARAADANLQTHTLARYISESTLQEYQFVSNKPSMIAAASMYLAIRMKKLGTWTPTLQHYSGFTIPDLLPMVHRLNDLISLPPPAVGTSNGGVTPTSTVRSKYSHTVFFEVALVSPLLDVDSDSVQALAELELLPPAPPTNQKS